MTNQSTPSLADTLAISSATSSRDVLTGILRDGAQRLLAHAIEAEVAEFIDSRAHLRDADGHRAVVRNGHLPARSLVTGVGSIQVKQPRVRDRRTAEEGGERFTSKILPRYLRKAQAIEELIPWLDLKGVSSIDPKLATGDGALGFWKALPQVYPATRADAHRAFDVFLDTYRAKHAAATACLEKDRATLLAFYDFPAEHWMHIRTTNPIESVFATVRLRTDKTKGSGSRSACLAMVFKLMESASKRWRALNGSALIPDLIAGVQFTDGIESHRIAA